MRKWMVAVAALLGLAMSLWWWQRPQPVPVALLTVSRGSVEALVANSRAGTLKACRRSQLSFNLGAPVVERLVAEGERVVLGQVLMRLRQDDQQARVAEAEARLSLHRNARQRRCAQADLDGREVARLRGLAERRLAAVDLLDRAQTQARLSALTCEAASAQIAESEAALALQAALLDQKTLRAPFAGIVAEINGEVGEFVTPSPPGIPTPPAVDLIDDSCLYVEAPIDEVDAARVHLGLPVRISLDAFRGQSFAGTVTRIAPFVRELEKQARTVDIEVRFVEPPPGLALLTGYSADVEILIEQREGVLRVPSESLLDGRQVLRYDAGRGLLRAVPVQIGLANWRWTEVRAGLVEGDRILPSLEQEEFGDGVAVVPQDVEPPP